MTYSIEKSYLTDQRTINDAMYRDSLNLKREVFLLTKSLELTKSFKLQLSLVSFTFFKKETYLKKQKMILEKNFLNHRLNKKLKFSLLNSI